MATPEELQNAMEFDRIVLVDTEGNISNTYISAGDVDSYFDLSVGEDGTDYFEMSEGWTLLQGYTGQYGYNGPVMHPSEFIGGRLARDILETPGYYVALVVNAPCDYDGTTECDIETGCDCEPAGWAIAFKPLEDENETTEG